MLMLQLIVRGERIETIMEIIGAFFNFLLQWYVWLPIVAVLGYLTWRNYRRAEVVNNTEGDLLILEIPKTNDKKELAAEQMFVDTHSDCRLAVMIVEVLKSLSLPDRVED